jgi:hypothetical protein
MVAMLMGCWHLPPVDLGYLSFDVARLERSAGESPFSHAARQALGLELEA